MMSIEYQNSKDGYNLAEQMKEEYIDNGSTDEPIIIDDGTGEVTESDGADESKSE